MQCKHFKRHYSRPHRLQYLCWTLDGECHCRAGLMGPRLIYDRKRLHQYLKYLPSVSTILPSVSRGDICVSAPAAGIGQGIYQQSPQFWKLCLRPPEPCLCCCGQSVQTVKVSTAAEGASSLLSILWKLDKSHTINNQHHNTRGAEDEACHHHLTTKEEPGITGQHWAAPVVFQEEARTQST